MPLSSYCDIVFLYPIYNYSSKKSKPSLDISIKMTSDHWYQVCQILNFQNLAHQIHLKRCSKCQILLPFGICYSTILRQNCIVRFLVFFIQLSLSPQLKVAPKKKKLSICLASLFFANLFYYSAYFQYYSWVSLHFLALFMDLNILFQLTFTFIYNTFRKKFSVSAK